MLEGEKRSLEGSLQKSKEHQNESERASVRYRRDSEVACLEAERSRQALVDAIARNKEIEKKLCELEKGYRNAEGRLGERLEELSRQVEEKASLLQRRDKSIADLEKSLAELRSVLQNVRVSEETKKVEDTNVIVELEVMISACPHFL